MITSKRSVKRAAAGVTAGLLVASGIAVGAVTASADENFTFERLAGTDRYGTAANIATETFTTADTVVLASGGPRNFPDALSGNYLAGALTAPILLTPNTSLAPATRDALAQLDAENVVIVGGTGAVSAGVEQALETAGYTVTREAGVDRYQTAKEVAESQAATSIGSLENKGRTAILASGEDFADALTAGPVAFANRIPVLLTGSGGLNSATAASLDTLGIDHVVVVGGTARITAATETAVRENGERTTTRLAGQNRQQTAVAIANYARQFAGFVNTHVDLATGQVFADALAGGPHAGVNRSPILLTDSATTLGASARDYLRTNCSTLTEGHIFGGTAAVSDAVATEASLAARCAGTGTPSPSPSNTATPTASISPSASATPTATASPSPTAPATNQAFSVSPTTTQLQQLDANGNAIVQYTFSGLTPGKEYNVSLFPCGDDNEGPSVSTDGAGLLNDKGASDVIGNVSFLDDNADDLADNEGSTQNGNAQIETVGFTPIGARQAVDQQPAADGTLVVRVSNGGANLADCAIPVVYEDNAVAADGTTPTDNDQLDLKDRNATTPDNDNTAAEPVGVGPAAVFFRGEQVNAANFGNEVIFVDKDANSVILGDGYRYNYDAADTFSYQGSEVDYSLDLATFEAYLNVGDYLVDEDINGNSAPYSRTNPNRFQFEDDTTAAPAGVTLEVGNFDADTTTTAANDIRATVTPASPLLGDVDQYCFELFNGTTNALVTTECTDEVNSIGTGDAATTVVFEDVAEDGTFVVKAYADSETDDSSSYSPYSVPVTVNAVPNDTTAPTSTDARITNDILSGDTAASGDNYEIVFSEPIVAAAAARLRLTDADGSVGDVVCGTNATCTVNTGARTVGGTSYPANRVLTVTLTGAPTVVTAGSVAGLQYPLTITDSSGIKDVAGNEYNEAGSPDRVIDEEA